MAARRWRVTWSDAAWSDLEAALDYIGTDSPDAANRVAARVVAAIDTLEAFGLSGRVVPDQRDITVRELIVNPYRLNYRVIETEIVVIAFLHGSMDLGSRLRPRLTNPD